MPGDEAVAFVHNCLVGTGLREHIRIIASGKVITSFDIARKLARYLDWTGYRAQVFNVGNYRRERFGAKVPASFFDPSNDAGIAGLLEVYDHWVPTGMKTGV